LAQIATESDKQTARFTLIQRRCDYFGVTNQDTSPSYVAFFSTKVLNVDCRASELMEPSEPT
jgi:hypothetical protein